MKETEGDFKQNQYAYFFSAHISFNFSVTFEMFCLSSKNKMHKILFFLEDMHGQGYVVLFLSEDKENKQRLKDKNG